MALEPAVAEAEADLTQAVTVDPTDGAAWLARSLVYEQQEHRDRSAADYAKAVAHCGAVRLPVDRHVAPRRSPPTTDCPGFGP